MTDEQIIELYFARSENAIDESRTKYGAYCTRIAMNILNDALDSEECVNDTWFGAWRSIPPKRPSNLASYFGRITRNISINRYKTKHADKRLLNEFTVSLDELSECIPGGDSAADNAQAELIGACISEFLRSQKTLDRRAFVCRYFYCDSISDIADHFGISESRVKSLLFRMRARLKLHLAQNDIMV